jgi:hypothetical protein
VHDTSIRSISRLPLIVALLSSLKSASTFFVSRLRQISKSQFV